MFYYLYVSENLEKNLSYYIKKMYLMYITYIDMYIRYTRLRIFLHFT